MQPSPSSPFGRRRHTVIASGSGPERMAAWDAVVRGSGRAEVDPDTADRFTADVHTYSLGEALVTRVASPTFRFLRSRDEAARVVRDQLFVNLVEQGRFAGRMAGRRIGVEAGGVLVTRLGVAMDMRIEDAAWYGFLVPLARLSTHMAWRPALDAKVFEPGSASAVLIGYHLRSLLELPDDLPTARAARIAKESLRFLLPHLGGRGDDDVEDLAPEDERALVVRRFIGERLADPGLDADLICREFALSRSSLYRLLRDGSGAPTSASPDDPKGGAGIASLIRRLRLLCAHRDIAADPVGGDPSLSAIGRRWGMPDDRTFRRAFAAEFGYPPSQARLRAAADPSTPASMEDDAAREIERWFGV